MAGWLGLAGAGIRSVFTMFVTFPKTPFRAIPRQQPRTYWEERGRKEGGKRERSGRNCEITE